MNDPQSSSPQSPRGTGAGLGSGIRILVGRLNCTPDLKHVQGQGRPPRRALRAVTYIETKVARDFGVQSKDFGVKRRD